MKTLVTRRFNVGAKVTLPNPDDPNSERVSGVIRKVGTKCAYIDVTMPDGEILKLLNVGYRSRLYFALKEAT